MALFLVQHGKSLLKNIDKEQGLSEEGTRETSLIADVAKGYKINPSVILHTTKKRAIQTAHIFNLALNPEYGTKEVIGINPKDDAGIFADTINISDNIMIIGHLPFMEKLTSFLTTGSADYTVLKFQNSGIVCLDKEKNGPLWYIKWALMPNIS